jgi:type IV secretory pathway VirB6-like protein
MNVGVNTYIWCFIALVVFWLIPDPALAQFDIFVSPSAACQNDIMIGKLFESERECSTDLSIAGFICRYEDLLSEIFGNLYCGIQDYIRAPLSAALTLLIVTFGAAFALGITPLTHTEAFKNLMKFILVWVFATEAEYGIQIAYNFLMAAARETSGLVTVALASEAQADTWDGSDAVVSIGNRLSGILDFFTSEDKSDPCQNTILTAILVTFALVPPLFFFGVMMLIQFFIVVLKAVLGYLIAITGITFSLTLMPFFLSFALFRSTIHLFEQWVQLIISFTLQTMIIFAFVSFVLLIDFGELKTNLKDIVIPYEMHVNLGPVKATIEACTLCEIADPNAKELQCTSDKKPTSVFNIFKSQNLITLILTKLLAIGAIIFVISQLLGIVPRMAAEMTKGMASVGQARYPFEQTVAGAG